MKDNKIYLQLNPEQLNTFLKIVVREILVEEKIIEIKEPPKNHFPSISIGNSKEVLITQKEVSKILNLSITKVKHKIYKNQIPYTYHNGCRRMVFKKSEILKLLDKRAGDLKIENRNKCEVFGDCLNL